MTLETLLAQEQTKIGQTIGISPWQAIDQAQIDGFAQVTGDHQFIHVDPVAAAAGPFGAPIAHGFLTLSLIATVAPQAIPMLPGQRLFINYGFDKVRFLSPVGVGAEVRSLFTLRDVTLRGPGHMLHTLDVTVEIRGQDKPALVATWLSLAVFEQG